MGIKTVFNPLGGGEGGNGGTSDQNLNDWIYTNNAGTIELQRYIGRAKNVIVPNGVFANYSAANTYFLNKRITNIDFSNLYLKPYMCYNCTSLTTISNFKTKNTPNYDLNYSFYNCRNLYKSNLALNWIQNAVYGFAHCSNLRGGVTYHAWGGNVSFMFYNCSNLQRAYLAYTSTSFDSSFQFAECSNLYYITHPEQFMNSTSRFLNCRNLTYISFNGWQRTNDNSAITYYGNSFMYLSHYPNRTTDLSSMFSGCTRLANIVMYSGYTSNIANFNLSNIFKGINHRINIFVTRIDGATGNNTALWNNFIDAGYLSGSSPTGKDNAYIYDIYCNYNYTVVAKPAYMNDNYYNVNKVCKLTSHNNSIEPNLNFPYDPVLIHEFGSSIYGVPPVYIQASSCFTGKTYNSVRFDPLSQGGATKFVSYNCINLFRNCTIRNFYGQLKLSFLSSYDTGNGSAAYSFYDLKGNINGLNIAMQTIRTTSVAYLLGRSASTKGSGAITNLNVNLKSGYTYTYTNPSLSNIVYLFINQTFAGYNINVTLPDKTLTPTGAFLSAQFSQSGRINVKIPSEIKTLTNLYRNFTNSSSGSFYIDTYIQSTEVGSAGGIVTSKSNSIRCNFYFKLKYDNGVNTKTYNTLVNATKNIANVYFYNWSGSI